MTDILSGMPEDSLAELAQLVPGAPAAVLLIDLATSQVSYANSVAAGLTGERVRLPVDVDAWSEAAGLVDLSGKPLRGAGSPLSRAATGQPVSGEPVAARGAPRRDPSAGWEQHERAEARLLWVSGFRLSERGSQGQALVVLLRLTPGDDAGGLDVRRARAVLASGLSVTISDPSAEDNPLVWVNQSFTRLTGYPATDAIGRNCRFLQGPNTDRATVDRISQALQEQRAVTEVLLNYRKDGSAFWNQISISPVTGEAGELVNFVGVQSDVTERVVVENERETALTSAQEASRELRMLTEATLWMNESLDVAEAADRLAQSVVPALADYCAVDLLPAPGDERPRRVAAQHRDPARLDLLYRLAQYSRPRVGGLGPISEALTTGEPQLLADMPEQPNQWGLDDPDALDAYRTLRPRSLMSCPLRARGRVLGVLTVASEQPYGRRFRQRDLYLCVDLAARAALAVDNARLYAREHEAAETLQLSLLPRLVSTVAGLRVAARYQSGADDTSVGGDWYDVLALPDGAVGLAVGDVVGHDLAAAAAMGQLRGLLRSYAWEGLRAGAVLDRCDQLVQGLEMAEMATALYARLGPPDTGGHRQLAFSNAGHPPAVLRLPGGETRYLDGQLSPLLGAVPGVVRGEQSVPCPPGSLLVFYTDGLVDLPNEDVDDRQQRLLRLVAQAPDGADIEQLCDRVLAELVPDGATDDVALLAVFVETVTPDEAPRARLR